ncbi:MAG: NHL repeat-containing protein, partial [Polyangiales bacterium]
TGIAVGGPTATGSGVSYDVVADTNNNRVLLGTGFFPSPWTAETVLGQRGSTTSNVPNVGGISEQTMNAPRGVALDGDPSFPTRDPRIYVADTGNNRVLVFNKGAIGATEKFGQADFDKGEKNRGGAVGKDTLDEPSGVAVYNGDDLLGVQLHGVYVADTSNNRVLFFRQFLPDAVRVYGQGGDFTSAVANKGGISASSLDRPVGVAVDPEGGLYVADAGNHRVLHFAPGKIVADQVYGQPGFNTANVADPSPTTLRSPTGVAVTPAGDLLVADSGNVRVVRFAKGCGTSCDDGDPCTNDFCNPVSGCVHQIVLFSIECSPYRCDNAMHACTNKCMTVGDCDPTSHSQCKNGVCVSSCGTAAECKSGHCVDGYCCNTACDGPCESCRRPGFEGTCIPVPAGQPERTCPLTIEGECGTRCNGVDGTTCSVAKAGSACGVESCTDGEQRTRGTCDGTGACISQITSCAPYACTSGGCRTSCVFDYECVGGARCVEGACKPGFGAEAAGGGCGFGHARGASLSFALALSLCAVLARRRR